MDGYTRCQEADLGLIVAKGCMGIIEVEVGDGSLSEALVRDEADW